MGEALYPYFQISCAKLIKKFDLLERLNLLVWALNIMLQLSLFVLALDYWLFVVLIIGMLMVGLMMSMLNTAQQNSLELVDVRLHIVGLNWIILTIELTYKILSRVGGGGGMD